MKLDYVIEPISALDGYYLDRNTDGWLDLESDTEMDGTICHAYRENDKEVGRDESTRIVTLRLRSRNL